MSVLKEFRDFAMKGNVVDLAVWVIIGTAFGKIVTSLVEDVIMPPIGWVIGNVDFTDLKLALPAVIEWQKAVTINYGNFLQILLNFIIIAFCIFMIVKMMNKAVKKKPAADPTPAGPTDVELLTEIRDLLKKKSA
jgi:large conductance mechanosensitive channel